MIKFRSVFERYEASELNQIDAAALACWTDGCAMGSGKRVPAEREQQIETLYRTRYDGITAKYFHEHLVRDHVALDAAA